ncbi:MAG: AAA family ATPase [Imperialibacter sp.]|uniref:ATP-dependent nuclease n=1 Tax=Imperialibacter sp. TaxID=2038411 RepID=UPI0032EE1943
MKIHSVRIRNFRTVREETLLEIDGYLTVVGPNNSGKTNILKSIQTFFTGYDNELGYSKERDFSKSADKKGKTTITVVFKKEEGNTFDDSIFEEHAEIYDYLESDNSNPNEITVYLTFNESTPNYQLHYNVKKKTDKLSHYSQKLKSIISKILSHFSVHYIPSEKSVKDIFRTLITPLVSIQLGKKMLENREIFDSVFTGTSISISTSLKDCGLENFEFSIRPPQNEYSQMIKGFEFILNDSIETNVFEKGMGIQTASLLACFLWVTEQETKDEKDIIWLLEEPESFLHPSLSETHKKLLHKLRTKCTVINSTHSLQFVPQDPMKILGTEIINDSTEVKKFKTYADATKVLRDTLGIEFSHFFNLGLSNVFLEGQTDREYFHKILSKLPNEFKGKALDFPILNSGETKFLDFGGSSHLEGFLKTTYAFICKERPTVSVFDGDSAGLKSVNALQGYFGNHGVLFRSNQEYVILKKDFEIEYYFPDEWLTEINNEHSGWFESFTTDVEQNLISMSVKDSRKESFQNEIFRRIDDAQSNEWLEKWLPILETIETSLDSQKTILKGG